MSRRVATTLDASSRTQKVRVVDGVAYILPRSEGDPKFVRKFGPLAVGFGFRWSSFGIGVDLLSAGALLMVGPAFIWIVHIKRQLSEYERKYLGQSDASKGEG